jgi:short-subunit dehydrogenase
MAAADSRMFVLITGASKGFGKEIALALAKKFSNHSTLHFFLTARSAAGLAATAQALQPHSM